MQKILIIDDEHAIRRTLGLLLQSEGYDTREAAGINAAKAQIAAEPVDLAITDLRLDEEDGMAFLGHIRDSGIKTGCIIMTAYGSIENAVASMRLGAFDYLTKPINPEELILRVKRFFEQRTLSEEVVRLRHALSSERGINGMVAASASMRGISDLIECFGSQELPVLIRGETGTGKELIARAVHEKSHRSEALFLPINCCALPEELLDSELFGHVKGAFTGAASATRGLFQQASGGTLFLDEIGDISPRLQTKLLRVLQDKVIRQVGGERQIDVDVRIIAATNRNLESAVESGAFRSDLFFRLNVLPINVPPLRERPDDVVPLIALFVDRIRRRTGRPDLRVTDAALKRLCAYDWPGNARQLENIIERAFAMMAGDVLDEAQILFDTSPVRDIEGSGKPPPGPAVAARAPPSSTPGIATLEEETLKHIRTVLAAHDGNQVAAARALGISRTTLRRRLGLGV